MKKIPDLSEIKRIVRDPDYRLRTIYKIVDKLGVERSLVPNVVQQRINAEKSKWKFILKARQFGVTTNSVIRLLDYSMWNMNRTTCILAHEQDGIKKIFNIARFAHSRLPTPFDQPVDKGGGSQYEMRFPMMNSKIYCDLESRGDTIHKLHISEAAFIKDPQRVYATMQAVPKDGEVTFETTANGLGNWTYDLWSEDNPKIAKLFFPWFVHDEYAIDTHPIQRTDDERDLARKAKRQYGIDLTDQQIAFRRAKQSELKGLFRQEYPEDDQTCFLSTGNAAIDAEIIKKMSESAQAPIESKDGLLIYEKVNRQHKYVAGADVAEGYDGDYSVCTVFDVVTMKQVAILRGHWKPFEFAHRINDLMNRYKTIPDQVPMLAVERNNHGHAVIQELFSHIRYSNLFQDKDGKLGWLTDRISRPLMIDGFIQALENNRIKLNCPTTLQECLTLVELDGKIEAGTSKHDDTIIACAIAVQLCINQSKLMLYENMGSMIRI